MNIPSYRKEMQESLDNEAAEQAGVPIPPDPTQPLLLLQKPIRANVKVTEQGEIDNSSKVLKDVGQPAQERIEALHSLSTAIGQDYNLLDDTLDIVADANCPLALRRAGLNILVQSSFRPRFFNARRAKYIEVLHGLLTERLPELAEQALEILAQLKDPIAGQFLLNAVKNSDETLISRPKAIQMLRYDLHGEQYDALRDIVATKTDDESKKIAVQLLASDTSNVDLLTQILRDKTENTAVRQNTATALQAVAPERFQQQAQELVLDDDEDDDLVATSLSALAHFSTPAALKSESALKQRAQHLKDNSPSEAVRTVANRYLEAESLS